MGKQEDALIGKLHRLFAPVAGDVGIGDDAAVVATAARTVLTHDMLVEDVDFTAAMPLELVAKKALAVNLSDIAAMGARPDAFLLALGFPKEFVGGFDRFVEALAKAATRWNVRLVGGDLSAAAKLTIAITAIGTLAGDRPLLRSGARPGDRLFLSRPVGGSAAGLQLLSSGWSVTASSEVQPPPDLALAFEHREAAAAAIRQHVAPEPELQLGVDLVGAQATSCIDVSDGLSSDVRRLCIASGCGAIIEAERIPLFAGLESLATPLGIDWRRCALHGGEEYALLFTARARESELSTLLKRPVYSIGRIVEGNEILLRTSRGDSPLTDEGFDHFAT